jgi:hypothetical protein
MPQLIDMTNFQESRHSRVLLAGIQAEFGLDPRLRHSGVTFVGVAFPSIPREQNFFVSFALFVVKKSIGY